MPWLVGLIGNGRHVWLIMGISHSEAREHQSVTVLADGRGAGCNASGEQPARIPKADYPASSDNRWTHGLQPRSFGSDARCHAASGGANMRCRAGGSGPVSCGPNRQIGQSAAVGGAPGRDDPSAHPKARETLVQKDRAAKPQGRSRLQNRWGRAWPREVRHECARNAFRRSMRGRLYG